MASASVGGFSLAVDRTDLHSAIYSMKAMPAAIKREIQAQGTHLVEPLAQAIRVSGAGYSPMSRVVAPTVRGTMRGGVPAVVSGTGGLAGKLGAGSEWGGGIRRKTYYSHRYGSPYLLTNRHTTRQFGRWNAGAGRWFWPVARNNAGPVLDGWVKLMDEVVADFHAGRI